MSFALRFVALPTEIVRAYQSGAPDANGQKPERRISDGDHVPCRHCLTEIAAGESYLVLAHRPFPALQPYAESGPIFLHAAPCARYADEGAPPRMFRDWLHLLIRGYGADDRIVYGTGGQIRAEELEEAAADVLADPAVAYVHVRSAQYNCYQCRIERAG
jgi:hypothetical protein